MLRGNDYCLVLIMFDIHVCTCTVRDSYRGKDLGYSPSKIHSVLTLFGIITTKYFYFTKYV